MRDDSALLRQFASDGDQDAFGEVVRRHVNLVYSAALRQVGGDSHLAQDVTQEVFRAMATSASRLAGRAVLTGWLYSTTRNISRMAVRTHRRWRQREQEANTMRVLLQDSATPQWSELGPVLDDAMHELNGADRDALLLRYFENRSFAEVGTTLGLVENSARMRVDRALDKLRLRLARRGITSTAAALGTALASQTVNAAPASLAALAVRTSLVGATSGGAGATALTLMSTTKIATGSIALAVSIGIGVFVFSKNRLEAQIANDERRQNAELAALRTENLQLRMGGRSPAASLQAVAPVVPAPAISSVARSQAVAELITSGMMTVTWNVASNDFKASLEDLSSLMGLSAAESDALIRSGESARNDIQSMAIPAADVRRTAEQLVIEIPELPETRARHAQMLAEFEQTLGAARYASIQAMGCLPAFESYLKTVGLGSSTFTLTRSYPRGVTQPASYSLTRSPSRFSAGGPRDFLLKEFFGAFDTLVPTDF